MADNPFDQFDTAAPAASTPPPADPARTPASAPPAAPPSANPFDQFDGQNAPAPAASATQQPAAHAVSAPDLAHLNAQMRQMFHSGASTADILAFGKQHNIYPNPAEIEHARKNGMDVQFVQPQDQPPAQTGPTFPTSPAMDGFADNIGQDLASVGKGIAGLPDMAATAAGKAASIIPNVISQALSAAGHTDAAKWIQDNITHHLANPPQIKDAIESFAPTPNTTSGRVNDVIGQLVGGTVGLPSAAVESVVGKLVGEAPRAVVAAPVAADPAAPDYVKLARDLKIKRTPATNSGTGTATVMQAGLGALPGGSPIGAAAEREVGGLAAAARNVAESVGPVSDRQGAGEAVAQGAQGYKDASKVTASGMYGQRDALIGGSDVPVPTDNAKSALDNIATRFPTSPAIAQLREHPAIRAIGGALPGDAAVENVPTGVLDASGNPITRAVMSGGEPLALGEVTEALSHVRGVVRNLSEQGLNGKATAPVLSRVKQLEQGLEDDVMNAAQKADLAAGRTPGAEGSAVKAQQDADAFYADRAGALNGSLKRPLQSAADDTKVSGESVYNQIAGDMDSKSGNIARLRDTWFRLPDQAKSTFAATRIDDLGRALPGQQNDAGSAWSFQSFLTNLNKMSPQARNIVFGAGADADLQKIAVYANRLRQLDKARNFSNTAQKYFAGAFMAAVIPHIMHGDIGGALETASVLPATWGGAKLLLSTPAMRDWTTQAMKALTTGNETGLRVLTKKLSVIAAAQPAFQDKIRGLQSAIENAANDNLHSLAASGGQQNPQGERNKAQGAR